ncbi:unnamed protein product [Hermetia illucens]|uniref:Uncharacterized protein n=1 Tax=Hermetia illucens TaxID=343691 RepID=A0A7R8UI97_HERIL|nr:unnamed protein product [Hermetia illucens]
MELDKIEDILKRKRELLQGYLKQFGVVTGMAAKSDAAEPDHEEKLGLVEQLTASIKAMYEDIPPPINFPSVPPLTENRNVTTPKGTLQFQRKSGHQPESSESRRDSDVSVVDTGSNNRAPDLGDEIEDTTIIETSDDDDCLEFNYEYPELL